MWDQSSKGYFWYFQNCNAEQPILITFQLRAETPAGAHLWSPIFTLECTGSCPVTLQLYPGDNLVLSLLHKKTGDQTFSWSSIVINRIRQRYNHQYVFDFKVFSDKECTQEMGSTHASMTWQMGWNTQASGYSKDQVTIKTDQPFKKQVFVQMPPQNHLDSTTFDTRAHGCPLVLPLDVVVCGNEQILLTHSINPVYYLPKDGGTFQVDVSSYFKDVLDLETSHESCFLDPVYKLCSDELCASPFTGSHISISGSQMSISKNPQNQELWVMKKLGSSQKAQKIRVKVCGAETVTNNRAEQTISNAKSATGTFTIQLTEYQADIVSSDTECPIIAYEIRQNGQPYTGSLVSLDSSSSAITFSFSDHYTQQQFQVYAWSEGAASGFFVINSLVYVCNEGADIVALFKAQCCNNQIFVKYANTWPKTFETSAATHTETSADIKALFDIRLAGCTIEKFQLIQNGAPYTGTSAQIDATTGQLTIDKSIIGITELQIKASGFQDQGTASKSLRIVICGPGQNYLQLAADQVVDQTVTITIPSQVPIYLYKDVVNTNLDCGIIQTIIEKISTPSSPASDNSDIQIEAITGGRNFKFADGGIFATNSFKITTTAYGGEKIVTQATLRVIPQFANYYLYPSCKPGCISSDGKLLERALYYVESTNKCFRHIDQCFDTLESFLETPEQNPLCLQKLSSCSAITLCTETGLVFQQNNDAKAFEIKYRPKKKYSISLSKLFDISSQITTVSFRKVQVKSGTSYNDILPLNSNTNQLTSSSTINFVGGNTIEIEIHEEHSSKLEARLIFEQSVYDCFMDSQRQYFPKLVRKDFEFIGQTDHNIILQNGAIVQSENFATSNSYPLKADLAFATGTVLTDMTFHMHELDSKFNFLYSKDYDTSSQSLTVDKVIKIVNKPSEPKIIFIGVQIESKGQQALKDLVFKFELGSPTQIKMQLVQNPIEFNLIFKKLQGEQYQQAEFNFDLSQLVQGETVLANIFTKVSLSEPITSYSPTTQDITSSLQILDQFMEAPPAVSIKFDSLNRKFLFKIARSFSEEILFINLKFLGGIDTSNIYDSDWLNMKIGVCNQPSFTPTIDQSHRKIYQYSSFMQNDFQLKVAYDNTGTHLNSACFTLSKDHTYVEEPGTSVGNSKDIIDDSLANAFIQISTSSLRRFQYNLKTSIQLPNTNTLFLPSELTVVKQDTIKIEIVGQDLYTQETFESLLPSDQILSSQYDISPILKLMGCATIRNCDRFIHLSLVREDSSKEETFSGKIFKETSFDLVKIASINMDTNIITFLESIQNHQFKIVMNSLPTDMQADPVTVKPIIQVGQTIFKAFLRTEFSPITVSITDNSSRINFLCNQESSTGECTDKIIIGQLGDLNPLILQIDLEEQPSSYWIGKENKAVWITDDQASNQLRWKLASWDYNILNTPYCECKSFKWYFKLMLPHDPSRVLKLQVSSSAALGQNIVREGAPSYEYFGRYNTEKAGFFILEVNILDIFIQTHAFDEMVVVDVQNENQLLSNSSLIEWYFNGQLNHLQMIINEQLFNIEQKLRLRHKDYGFQSISHSIYPKYCNSFYKMRLSSKEVSNQTFILTQSLSEFEISSEQLQKWFELSEIPQNQKEVCLQMRLLDQNCQMEVQSYSQIKFKKSRIEDKESLRVIQATPFNLRQYCFEMNSRSGVRSTLLLNFAVCTRNDPPINTVVKPIEVVMGTSIVRIYKNTWIEKFEFEQPECAAGRNYTLKVDRGYENTLKLDDETNDILIDTNSPDIKDITDSANFKFRTYAQILGGVKYTNEYTVVVSVIKQNVEVEEFPETFIKNWFQNQTIRLSFNLTAEDTEANEDSNEEQKDPIIQQQSLFLIDQVKGGSEIIAPVSKDPEMKQKLQDYQLKLWLIIKVKDGAITFDFDNSTIPLDERLQLIQSGLQFNVTVKYDKKPYKYKLDLSFNDESKSDEAASDEESQTAQDEESNKTQEEEKPKNEKKGKQQNSNLSFQVGDLQRQKQLELLERQKREKEERRQKLLMEYGFPKVKFIFKDMKVNLNFNQPMNIPIDEDGKLMTDFIGKVKVLIISAPDASVNIGSNQKSRRLQELEQNSLLSFSWYATQWTQETVEIELRMENPEAVSTQGGYDMMALIIDDLKLKSNLTGEEIDIGSMKNIDCGGQLATFCRPMYPMITDQEQVEVIQNTGDAMQESVETILGSNMAITLLVGGSLQQLWGLIRSMQYINMLALVNVMYPPNAFLALQITNDIASLDVLDGENFHDVHFEFKETEALNPNFEAFGSDNLNFILNSGSLMLILFYMVLSSMIFVILNQIARIFFRFYIWRQIGIKVQQNDLKYQLQIFLLEGYIDLGFASVLNILAFSQSTSWNEFKEFFADFDNLYCSLSAIISFVAVIIIPFYVLYTLTVNFDQLHHRKSREQFGHFFEGLHYRNYHSAIYQVYFMFKRLLVILTIVLIKDYPQFQVMIFIGLTLLDLAYVLRVLPFKSRKENIIEIVNQFTFLLWCYSQYLILDYSIDTDARTSVGWFIIALCGGNMMGLLIEMTISGIYDGFRAYVKNKITKKAISLERKQIQNRQQIVQLVPGEFSQFEYQLGYLEAIDICKKWKPQRDWLIAQKVPYQDLPEELQYQKLMKEYKFAERRDILLMKYTEGLKIRKEEAENRKSAKVTNVKTLIKQELIKVQQRKSLSLFGKDPRKVMSQQKGQLQQIDENSSENEEVIPIKAKESNQKLPEEFIQLKTLISSNQDKIIRFGEETNDDLKKLKTLDLDKNSAFGKLVHEELKVQEQMKPLKNEREDFEQVDLDFMNESDVDEFEIEEKFKSKFDFVGETDYQIMVSFKKLGRNQQPRGNGIVGLQNLKSEFSHVNSLVQCLIALGPLREWNEPGNMTVSEQVISQMIKDVFSVSKSGKENMQFIVDLSYLETFYERISHKGIKKIKDIRNPHTFLNILVQDQIEGSIFFGKEQFIVYQFKHQVGQHQMSRLFSNLLRQNLKCLNCKSYNKLYRRTTGIHKLESDAKNLQEQLADHFGTKKDRKLQPSDDIEIRKCWHCNKPFNSKNYRLNIDLMIQAPIQVIQIERYLGQKEKYYKEIEVPLEIQIQGKDYELKGLIGFPIFNPHGDQRRVLEHFVAYTLRDTQLNTEPRKDIFSKLKSLGQNKDKLRWIEFDDEQYRPVTEKEMLDFARKNAYMLFYVEK